MVHYSKGKMCQLYKLVNNLTNSNQENMFHPGTDEDLSKVFLEYFMSKIKDIRHAVAGKPKYEPTQCCEGKFYQFHEVAEDDVEKLILRMPTKSCKLDAIPTQLLKQILPAVLTPITDIINTSLQEGIFPQRRKTAIVKEARLGATAI